MASVVVPLGSFWFQFAGWVLCLAGLSCRGSVFAFVAASVIPGSRMASVVVPLGVFLVSVCSGLG